MPATRALLIVGFIGTFALGALVARSTASWPAATDADVDGAQLAQAQPRPSAPGRGEGEVETAADDVDATDAELAPEGENDADGADRALARAQRDAINGSETSDAT